MSEVTGSGGAAGAAGAAGAGTGSDAGSTQAEDAGEPAPPACPSTALQRVLPTLVLLIDQSGSMAQDFGSLTRWDTMVQALTSPESPLRSRQQELRLGAVLYTSDGGFGSNPEMMRVCPRYSMTPAQPGNYETFAALLSTEGPEGDSPGAEALSAVALQVAAVPDTAPAFLLWIGDGNTDTCEDPALFDEPTSTALSVQALSDAFALGISTQIISLGTETPTASLQAMARAGAGGDESAVGHQVTSAAQLATALSATVDRVHSCEFELVAPLAEAAGVSLKLNGVELELSGADGWELTSAGRAKLLGTACTASLTPGAEVTAAARLCP